MSLLDSIVLGNEKVPIVLDIGSAYTKCGYAGEYSPRHIIPSYLITYVNGKKKRVKIVDYSCDKSELYKILKRFIHDIFFQYLLVNPKDRRVVVVESILCPTVFRTTLAKVLFEHFEISCCHSVGYGPLEKEPGPQILFLVVQSTMYGPSHLMGLFSLGIANSLIIECGYNDTTVIPFFCSIPLFNCTLVAPLAGKAVNAHLKKLLHLYATVTYGEETKPFAAEKGPLPEDIIEEIKVCACVAGFNPKYQEIAPDTDVKISHAKPMKFHLGPSKILTIPAQVREGTLDVLFDMTYDDTSVATLILDCLLQCPVDIRKELAANISIIGGCAATPGFSRRLKEELVVLANSTRYKDEVNIQTFKFHEAIVHPNCAGWLGGSICGVLDNLGERSVLRETFLKEKFVPDWTHSKKRLRNVAQTIMNQVSGEKTPHLASVVTKIMSPAFKAKLANIPPIETEEQK